MTTTPKPKPRPRQRPLCEALYFVFTRTYGEQKCARISRGPELPFGSHNWRSGQRLAVEFSQPLVYEIDDDDEGKMIPFYRELSAPLMSTDLISALQAGGVNNLDLYDALIRETRTGKEHENYKAVNIVGLVHAADDASETTSLGIGGDESLLSVWFNHLVISDDKARGLLLFRLAENVSLILIHKSVKDYLESSQLEGIEHLRFIHPARWRG